MAAKERFNIVFPADVMAELRASVPARKRSDFIIEATSKELKRLKQKAILEHLRKEPAWKVEDHPDMVSPQDVELWVDALRSSWQRPASYPENSDA